MIKIGSVKIDTNIFLAPLSGCSDLAFREISREYGAKFSFFEMICANALIHGHLKTLGLLDTNKKDRPIAAQLLGSDPLLMADAAQKLCELVDISFLDINSACPAKKVTTKGSGACLLEDHKTLLRICKKMINAIDIPLTIKIRVGYGKRDIINTIKLSKILEDAGISAIFVHGRSRSQGYSGSVDYDSIKAVKDSVSIPVFGSGDILSSLHAIDMFKKTGCDGILVARGAFGSPWIFNHIEKQINSGKVTKEPSLTQRKRILKKHLKLFNKYKNIKENAKVGHMRKICMWYLKGLPKATRVRESICMQKSYKELLKFIDDGIL